MASLFISLVPFGIPGSFLRELSIRSFEEIRLLRLFFGQMLRFCFFNHRTDYGPLCSFAFSSEHFFECPVLDPLNNFPDRWKWRDRCRREEWEAFINAFFSIALLWRTLSSSVRNGHMETIQRANSQSMRSLAVPLVVVCEKYFDSFLRIRLLTLCSISYVLLAFINP